MTDGHGPVVVLGASREGGTGWAIAEALSRQGRHVTVGARTRAGIDRLAAQIDGTATACDATVEGDVARFVDAAVAARGPLESAVLVAGEGVVGNIDDMPEAEFERCLRLNLYAPVYFVRHAARRLRDGGSIVLMTSIAATNPWQGYFAYGAAKAAVHALVGYAALEYAPRRIRVNAVCPGPIETAEAAERLRRNPHVAEALTRETPLGRRATAAEVAEAVAWLALGAPAITGEWLQVNGGLHLRRPPSAAEMSAAAQRDAAAREASGRR
jgi:NAD(P)-dependent dehydrogenase (short-subunit alcohol dehydrogenase family)